MIKLDQLIKASVREDLEPKNKNKKSEGILANNLFDIADKVTNELNTKTIMKKNSDNRKIKVKNITFSLSLEAEEIFDDIIHKYRKSTGDLVKKSHILIASIKYFAKLDGDSLVSEIKNQQFAEMGRPKK